MDCCVQCLVHNIKERTKLYRLRIAFPYSHTLARGRHSKTEMIDKVDETVLLVVPEDKFSRGFVRTESNLVFIRQPEYASTKQNLDETVGFT